MKIWTVDAFASLPFTGNPAAVAVVEDFPTEELCQKIAAEMNLSETVFVKPLQGGDFHIRWFTPLVEVELCGHGTLAASHILFTEGFTLDKEITFHSLSGPLMVHKEGTEIVMDFPLQKAGERIPRDPFANLLDPSSIIDAVRTPDVIIVELATADAVRNWIPPMDLIAALDCVDLIITAKGDGTYDFVSRVFAPRVGIDEDPVTGSAHCKLADYWQKKLGKSEFLAYQASPRGGELGLHIKDDRLLIKGHAITLLAGELRNISFF